MPEDPGFAVRAAAVGAMRYLYEQAEEIERWRGAYGAEFVDEAIERAKSSPHNLRRIVSDLLEERQRTRRVVIVAPSYHRAEMWMKIDNIDPFIFPGARNVSVVCSGRDAAMLRGIGPKRPEDRLVVLGYPERWQDSVEIRQMLLSRQWAEAGL